MKNLSKSEMVYLMRAFLLFCLLSVAWAAIGVLSNSNLLNNNIQVVMVKPTGVSIYHPLEPNLFISPNKLHILEPLVLNKLWS